VGVPSNWNSAITIKCDNACDSNGVIITWNSLTRVMTFKNLFPEAKDYLPPPGPVSFQVRGWTNPATSEP